MKQLWEELKNHESPYTCCCGRLDCASLKRIAHREEQDRILKFLTGLNDTFTATRGQILMMDPRPNISKVFNLISQEERQRSMKSTSVVAFQVSQTAPDDQVVAAYNFGYNKQKQRPICSHCGISGHTVNRCYKLHGYPQGYKSQYKNSKASTPTNSVHAATTNRKDNVANMIVQNTGGISFLDQQGTHLGTVTTEQVNKLLSVLSIPHGNLIDNLSQISGSTISLSD